MLDRQQTGIVFNVQKFSVHDGEGIRTLVFLKGCPLHCPWCSNPESQRREPERAYNPTRCLTAAVCGRCAKACPTGAVSIVGGLVCFDRSKCTGCNACVRACPSGAQTVYGETQSVDQILSRVEEDGVFLYAIGRRAHPVRGRGAGAAGFRAGPAARGEETPYPYDHRNLWALPDRRSGSGLPSA